MSKYRQFFLIFTSKLLIDCAHIYFLKNTFIEEKIFSGIMSESQKGEDSASDSEISGEFKRKHNFGTEF